MNNYKEKIAMKFSVDQLDRIIITLLNNGHNKKFASNVRRLFNMLTTVGSGGDGKDVRVYLIKQISDIVTTRGLADKQSILDFIDTDGKYYNDCVDLLNGLFEEEIPDNEVVMLDKLISNQLKYGAIVERTNALSDKLMNIQSESYDDLGEAVADLEKYLDTMNRDIKTARESIENSRSDMSLSSDGFVNVLDGLIRKERNPATKVKTGIQYMNNMLNGGFEKGRLYCAMGVAKGWKSTVRHLK